MTIRGRIVITVSNGRTNTADEATVDMTGTVSTYRDLELLLMRALEAAKALRGTTE
jgi:hypothetical protein